MSGGQDHPASSLIAVKEIVVLGGTASLSISAAVVKDITSSIMVQGRKHPLAGTGHLK